MTNLLQGCVMLAYEDLIQARQPLVRVVHEEGEGHLLHLSFSTNYLRKQNCIFTYPFFLLLKMSFQ